MIQLSSLSAKWDTYVREPFPVLVRLSITRIVHGSNASEEDELNISMGVLLVLLAIPGGFVSIFLFDKYGSFLQWLRDQTGFDPLAAAFPDEYFFIVLSMAVTGGVAVWWWDSIFPDRRDFSNLVHLPLPTSSIFLANSTAILILTGVCAIDVNAASSVLFPLIVSGAQTSFGFVARFAGVHALVVVTASIFSFFAVFAIAGLLMLLLPYRFFRRVSLYVRTAIATVLLASVVTSFAIPNIIGELPRSPQSPVRYLPSAWFLGLCQSLHGRSAAALTRLGHVAIIAVLCACALSAITYTVAYQRCFIRLPELAGAPAGTLGRGTSWSFRLFDQFFRTPFQCAGYRFVLKTIFRNEAHALTMGGFFSLGIVFASHAMLSAFNGDCISPLPTAPMLSIPLILGYCLAVGLRIVFDVPAYIQANWIFRFLLDTDTRETVTLTRRIVLCFLAGILLPAIGIYAYFWGWIIALWHITVVVICFLLLTEILFSGFCKVPFTCTYPLFQPAAVVCVIGYALGYFGFAIVMSEFEDEALARPLTRVIFLALMLAVWYVAHRLNRIFVDRDKHLIFEDRPGAYFEFLHLSDDG